MAKPPIIILGAGLAGLTLGRCLKQRGVPVLVYDKHPSKLPRLSRNSTTLEPRAYKPLLKLFDMEEDRFKKSLAIDDFRNGYGSITAGDAIYNRPFRANRHRLELMMKGEGEDSLTTFHNHAVESATLTNSDSGDPSLTLHFSSHLMLRPSFVVDALGVHSALRSSLLPELQPTVEPYVVYRGSRRLDQSVFENIYLPELGDGNIVVRRPEKPFGSRVQVNVEYNVQTRAEKPREDSRHAHLVSWVYSRRAAVHLPSGDPLFKPDRGQEEAKVIPDNFSKEFAQIASTHDTMMRHLNYYVHFRDDRVLNWLMRTLLVPKQDLMRLLGKHGVAMIGDSVHAVPILGGSGANEAIIDALDLAEVIAEHWKSDTLRDGVKAFYERKWDYWSSVVDGSRTKLAEMHHLPLFQKFTETFGDLVASPNSGHL